jgi:flagellar basal body-associated protein FliL
MKNKKKYWIIIGIIISIFIIIGGYFISPYWTLEGKYKYQDTNRVCEFKDGYFIDNGEKAKYSIYFRTVYIDVDIEIHKNEEAGIKGSKRTEKFQVYIYWDHLEMPNIKGGRIILEPVNE